MNPVPVDVKPRVLSTSIDPEDPSASIELAFAAAEYFGLKHQDARFVAAENLSPASSRAHCATPIQAVIPAHAGIQYSSALTFDRESSGILGRPVEPGDDGLCMNASNYL